MCSPEREMNTPGNALYSALIIRSGLAMSEAVLGTVSPSAFIQSIRALWHREESNSALIDWANLTGFGLGIWRWVLFSSQSRGFNNLSCSMITYQIYHCSGVSQCVWKMTRLGGERWPAAPGWRSLPACPQACPCRLCTQARWECCLLSPASRHGSLICRAQGKRKMCDSLFRKFPRILRWWQQNLKASVEPCAIAQVKHP